MVHKGTQQLTCLGIIQDRRLERPPKQSHKRLRGDFGSRLPLFSKVGYSESHEESNLKPSDSALWCLATEPQGLISESGNFYVHMHVTCFLLTIRISNIESSHKHIEKER